MKKSNHKTIFLIWNGKKWVPEDGSVDDFTADTRAYITHIKPTPIPRTRKEFLDEFLNTDLGIPFDG